MLIHESIMSPEQTHKGIKKYILDENLQTKRTCIILSNPAKAGTKSTAARNQNAIKVHNSHEILILSKSFKGTAIVGEKICIINLIKHWMTKGNRMVVNTHL